MNTGKTYLITGGAGFIGSHLAEQLLQQGHRVTVIDDLSTGSEKNLSKILGHPAFTFIVSRVSACPELEKLVARTDVIFHLAAAVGVKLIIEKPLYSIRNNLLETACILELACKYKKTFLLTSTSEVYGKSPSHSFNEADDLRIGNPHLSRWSYACSKLMDEFMAMASWREHGTPVVITRLFNIVGPRQTGRYGMVLPRFVQAALDNKPLTVYGDGTQSRCFCHISDSLKALMQLTEGEPPLGVGDVFNIGTDSEISIADLARKVITLTGSKSEIEFIPYEKAYAPGFQDMMRRKPCLKKLLARTGFKPETALDQIILDIAQSLSPR
ncbi:MAG: GDP-mannose 4,6-dehydratase [Candidatus Methanomethylophilaceae archaeon]|nr:GDP-mannose 4,6-dehydratase [Candidatus Methanomethylophilaceae archaeon]